MKYFNGSKKKKLCIIDYMKLDFPEKKKNLPEKKKNLPEKKKNLPEKKKFILETPINHISFRLPNIY
ncbi:hypothetical protein [Sulfurimonas sp. NWX367]|uniref:hypothetical protein n=1 Tax=Sulfurimonas sp. NWX367 TaxID=2925413 RepID=UPI00320498CC